MNFREFAEQLEAKIQDTYEQGVTITQAEHLAGEMLGAQMQLSAELRKADLDARMRKTGVKAIRAAIYLEEATKSDKKPSDVMLAAIIDRDEIVAQEQKAFDEAEVDRDEVERLYNICIQAHIHFRTIAKGSI